MWLRMKGARYIYEDKVICIVLSWTWSAFWPFYVDSLVSSFMCRSRRIFIGSKIKISIAGIESSVKVMANSIAIASMNVCFMNHKCALEWSFHSWKEKSWFTSRLSNDGHGEDLIYHLHSPSPHSHAVLIWDPNPTGINWTFSFHELPVLSSGSRFLIQMAIRWAVTEMNSKKLMRSPSSTLAEYEIQSICCDIYKAWICVWMETKAFCPSPNFYYFSWLNVTNPNKSANL